MGFFFLQKVLTITITKRDTVTYKSYNNTNLVVITISPKVIKIMLKLLQVIFQLTVPPH